MIDFKDYKQWMKRKATIHNQQMYRYVNDGDVVWAAVGENVGVEIDGKSKKYSRPVVVLKKHGAKSFTGVPLTTRVYSRIGELSKGDFGKIKKAFLDYYSK